MTRRAGRRRWPTWDGAIAIGLVFATALGLTIARRSSRIIVSNRTTFPLTDVLVTHPGGTLDVGEIAPGTSVWATIWSGRRSGGRRPLTVRLNPGDGPRIEFRSELDSSASWEFHNFVAESTMTGRFRFGGTRGNCDVVEMLRELSRSLTGLGTPLRRHSGGLKMLGSASSPIPPESP